MKRIILAFLLGFIVAGSIGVVAYNYSAKDIAYTPSDSSWNVTNVGDAIEDLKRNHGGEGVEVARLTTQGATYTMQNDGYIVGTANRSNNGLMARLYLDNKVLALSQWDEDVNYNVSVYVTKDTTVRTRSDGGTYNLTVYEWK